MRDRADLIAAMMNVKDENGNGIEDDLIVDETLTFLFAGQDTTGEENLICFLLRSQPFGLGHVFFGKAS